MHRIRAQLFSHNNSPNCGKMNDGCALVGRHGQAHRHRPYPSPSYFSTQSHTNQITIYMQSIPTKPTVRAQSTQTNSTVPRAIWPNETVGAAPVCPPERLRSGVSIPKIHASRMGNERRMRPCRATRAGTQAPPLPISIIFFHAIPPKPNNHLRAIHPNGTRKQSHHTHSRGRKCIAHSRPHS